MAEDDKADSSDPGEFSHSVVSGSWQPGLRPWASPLSFTISRVLLKLMSVEQVMPSKPFHPGALTAICP